MEISKNVYQSNDAITLISREKTTKDKKEKKEVLVETVGESKTEEQVALEFAKIEGLRGVRHIGNSFPFNKKRPSIVGCVVALVYNGSILFGVSELSEKDSMYNKKKGVKIAEGRAFKTPCKSIKINDPSIVDERYLQSMCKAHFGTSSLLRRAITNQISGKRDRLADARLNQKKEMMIAGFRRLNKKNKVAAEEVFNKIKDVLSE